MVKVLSIEDVAKIIHKHGMQNFMIQLVRYIKEDFLNWHKFNKVPRTAAHVKDGVIELMPINNDALYSYKYVNGHPINPNNNKQTVIATGQLSSVEDGYPLLISEMTLLTAFRTAATAALVTDLMAKKDSTSLGLIGTGAQSEFQILAHKDIRKINNFYHYDVDPSAMIKFEKNIKRYGLKSQRQASAKDVAEKSDILIICTACKKHVDVIKKDWIHPGTHINGLGGDCPGKTEIDVELLPSSKIIVEYFDQSLIEGEIQRFNLEQAKKIVHAELWELLIKNKSTRLNDSEITIFDSVGFALEDYSALRLIYDLSFEYGLGSHLNMTPQISDPKNLFSALNC